MNSDFPKVFISYSWDSEEHKEGVLELADRLIEDGIKCMIDQYVMAPPQGWTRWMHEQIEAADFVLMVFTETYKRRMEGKEVEGLGKGGTWEGLIITNILYYQEYIKYNDKFIPTIVSTADEQHIPSFLRSFSYHNISTEQGYENLYRQITNQAFVEPPPLGQLKALPKRQRKTKSNP